MWTDNLRQFHFWCQKTLPLVYDDSLSYYEVLAKVTKHLNELTTLVNEIGDELERYEGVTDNRLDTLETWRTEVDTWRAQIDEWKADVNTWIEQTDDWKQSTENHLTAHDNWISYATGLINNTIMPFIEDMTARVGDIENRLSGAEDDIDALEGRMNTAEDDIDTLQSDVTSLDGRLDNAESAITGLDGRLDTAEDDIDNLESSMSTAEGDIGTLQDDVANVENDLDSVKGQIYGETRIISANVDYVPTQQAYCILLNEYDAAYIKKYITDAKIPGSIFGHKVKFLLYFSTNSYDYTDLYLLDEYSNKIQYDLVDAYINISHSTGSPTIDIYSGCTYMLDTRWTTAIPFVMNGEYDLPKAQSADNGKVISYNAATKRYELVTPSGGSTHTYSTTEQVVGTWVDGKTVYEKTYTGSTPITSTVIDTLPTTARLISADIAVIGAWSGASINRIYLDTDNGNLCVELNTSNGNLIIMIPHASTTWPFNYTAVIRYTKT